MTILYDGHGAAITSTIHEVEARRVWPQTLEEPGESWCRCTCGEEMDSQGSAGGSALTVGELFRGHLDDVEDLDGPDCGDAS